MDIFNYRQKMEGLQAKIRQSETERRDLETRLHQMMRRQNERDKTKMRSLKDRYENFLEEEKRRLARNDKLLQTMEDIDYRASTLAAKTERLKLLKSQYELYLTRTWCPTAAAAAAAAVAAAPAPMTLSGGVLGGFPGHSVVYKCPSSVNANPQLNIQYYRHSTADSCPPGNNYNQLVAPKIVLSRDVDTTPAPLPAHFGYASMMPPSSAAVFVAENNPPPPRINTGGILNANRPDTDSLSDLMAQGMSLKAATTSTSSNHHLMPHASSYSSGGAAAATLPLFSSSSALQTERSSSALPSAFVSDSKRAFESSSSSSSVYPTAATAGDTERLVNQSSVAGSGMRSQGYYGGGVPEEHLKEAIGESELNGKNRNTGNQLETFEASSSTAAILSSLYTRPPAADYYSSQEAPAGDLHASAQKYVPGKSNDDVNDAIIPASYRFVSLSEQQKQQQPPRGNSQQMPMDDGIVSARTNYNDMDHNNQNSTNFQGPELENYAQQPSYSKTFSSSADASAVVLGGKTKQALSSMTTSPPVTYRNTDHYFDDIVSGGGGEREMNVNREEETSSLGNKDILSTSSTSGMANSRPPPQQSVHQKWEKVVEVDKQQGDGRVAGRTSFPPAKSTPEPFIESGYGNKWPSSSAAASPPQQPSSSSLATSRLDEGRLESQRNYYDRPQQKSSSQEDLFYEQSMGNNNNQLQEVPEEGDDYEKRDLGNEKAAADYFQEEEQQQSAVAMVQPKDQQYINQNNYPAGTGTEGNNNNNNNNMSPFATFTGGPNYQQQEQLQSGPGGSPHKSFAYETDEQQNVSYATAEYSSPQKKRLQSPTKAAAAGAPAYYSPSFVSAPEGGNSNQGSPRKRMAQLQQQQQQNIEEEVSQPLEVDQSYYTQDEGGEQLNYPEESSTLHGDGGYTEAAHDAVLNQQNSYSSPTGAADPLVSATYQSQSHYPDTGAVDDYGGNYEESGYVADDQQQQQQEAFDYNNYLADAAAAPTDEGGDNDYQTNYPSDQHHSAAPLDESAFEYGHQTTAAAAGYEGEGLEYQDYYNQQGEHQNYSIAGQETENDGGANYVPADGNYAEEQGAYYMEQQSHEQHQGDYYQGNQLHDQDQQQQQQNYYPDQMVYNINSAPEPTVSFAAENTLAVEEVRAPSPTPPPSPPPAAVEKPKKPVKKVQILESSDTDTQPRPAKGKPTGSVLKGGLKNKRNNETVSSDSSDFNFSSK